VQWGIAYAAGAWGLLQGLPPVLVIAWYHGDRGHQRVTIGEFVRLTGLFLVGGGIFWRYAQQLETAPARVEGAAQAAPREAPPNSIAVLPFADLSETGDQQYFSDGIAEEILNALVGVDGGPARWFASPRS
jgi:hypothetical protein